MVWLSFGLGLFSGICLGILLMSLLFLSSEAEKGKFEQERLTYFLDLPPLFVSDFKLERWVIDRSIDRSEMPPFLDQIE